MIRVTVHPETRKFRKPTAQDCKNFKFFIRSLNTHFLGEKISEIIFLDIFLTRQRPYRCLKDRVILFLSGF